jgi:hypothetical protein
MLHRATRVRGGLSLALLACLLASGCANKVTKANFDKVATGMTLKEVEALLGKGVKEEGDGSGVAAQFGVDVGGGVSVQVGNKAIERYVWESGDKKITVYFQSGKATNKDQQGL